MTDTIVSVIMPAYNAQDYIAEAIDSVIKQTYRNWELLVINDGSTDNTAEIADTFKLQDNRIKVIHQANKKLGAARNAGIKLSIGNWIAFLDADDIWLPQKLERQLQLAFVKPQVGLIFTNGTTFNANSNETAPYETIYGELTPATMYKLLYKGNYIPVLSVLIKTGHVKAVGLQDESVRACEDWDYWLRCCLYNVTFYGMDEKLFRYRRHSLNMSNNNDLMRFAKASVLLKNFRTHLLGTLEIAALKSFINITICHFLRLGHIAEAQSLNSQMNEVFANPLRRFSDTLINILKQRSYYLLRTLFKIERLIYKSVGNA